jgi:hypothetical protein
MRHIRIALVAVAAVVAALGLALTPGTAVGAHNGNNSADISGTGDPDATGQAIVNYSKGSRDFNGRISVRRLTPFERYTFSVRTPGPETVICSSTANANGLFACSAQRLMLPGFSQAVVRDSSGAEVAVGVFERRGNCRDPQQAGSQCEAPGQTG